MNIQIVTPDPSNAQAWRNALHNSESAFRTEAHVGTLPQWLTQHDQAFPDALVLQSTAGHDLRELEWISTRFPQTCIIVVSEHITQDVLLQMMRAGVREVMPSPAGAEQVLEVVNRLTRKRAATLAPQAPGKVVAFISCKGGSGSTFLATNLAWELGAQRHCKVALIDLNLQFGDAVLFICSEKPPGNLAELAKNIDRLDPELLRSSMLKVTSHLHVLAAPEDPAQASDVSPTDIQAILRLASSLYDYVIIDAGRALNSVTLQALDMADEVHAVLQLTLPFIRDGKRLQQVFRSLGYPKDKIHWLVNRFEKGGRITMDDLRKTLDTRDLIAIPNQYDAVAASVNQGESVLSMAPRSAVSVALRELADLVAPASMQPKGDDGLFSGLLRSMSTRRKTP